MIYDNPWTYNGTHVTDADAVGLVGFVYLIENLTTGRKYIGKKRFFFTKTRTVKKKKKREKVISDWKEYYGSNKELQADVERLGGDMFSRKILYMCTTLGECSYYEAYEQFTCGVLLSDDYYNGFIGCKISTSHLPKRK
jgi:hypothetical protein